MKVQPSLSITDKLKGLHIVYCTETGNALAMTNHRQDQWSRFDAQGFTADDLRCVIQYIRRVFYRKDSNCRLDTRGRDVHPSHARIIIDKNRMATCQLCAHQWKV